MFNWLAPAAFEPVNSYVLTPVGQLFLKLIMMLVVPLVFFSIALGTAGIGNPKKLGRIGGKTILFFLCTTAIALIIGLTIALVVQPGDPGLMGEASEFSAEEAPPIIETIMNIIPTNPVEALASGEMLQIIAFAVFVGLAMAVLGEKTKGLLKLFEQANDIMMYLVTLVMKVAPYGAFALIASALGEQGWRAFGSMVTYMTCVIGALLIHSIVVYGAGSLYSGK